MQCPLCRFENQEGARICENCDTPLRPAKEVPAAETETVLAPVEELIPGAVFANRYQVIEEIGRGGIGRVYKVMDYKINEQIALKLIKPEAVSGPEAIERFGNDLRLARKVRHKNVCGVFDLGQAENTHFITMEYVSGENLKMMIQMMGTLSVATVLSVGKQVSDGLAEAHSLGIVHRDLKPQNIMIEKGGNAKIMDLGIARSILEKGITGPTAWIGTPEYVSPEQAEGKDVDHLSDIYSLGVVLYEIATGRVPFEGETALGIAMKHKDEIPKNPKKFNLNVPDALSEIILKCLEKDKTRRYQNAIEVREDLEKLEKILATAEPIVPERKIRPSKVTAARFDLKKILVPGLIAVAAVILAALVIQFVISRKGTAPAKPDKPSVAVLPFEGVGPAKDYEYLCKGIPDSLIKALSRIKDLRVPARTSSFFFEESNLDVREIGRELGVEHILRAAVEVLGDKLRIAARLTRIGDGSQVWSDQYERNMEDIFVIQDDLAQKIVRALKIKLSGEEKKELAKRPTDNLKAYTLYLQGRLLWGKRSKDNLLKAIELFESAIREDPGYALAYTGIADSCFVLAIEGLFPSKDCYTKALSSSLQALQIDESLAEAHCSLASVRFFFEYNWLAAEMEFQRAIELNPAYAPAHAFFGFALVSKGRFNQAISEIELARDLDPFSARIQRNVGLAYLYARRYDRAIEILKRTIENFPEESESLESLGSAYFLKSMYDQALAIFQKIDAPAHLGIVYAKMGRRAEAQKIINELVERSKNDIVSAYDIARLCFSTGEVDQGFNWLYRAYAERGPSVSLMKVDPFLDNIRLDPRYNDLLRKMNLDL
jgi:serine/threonine protein kinase/Tfp pilus assembly protein PilF